MAAIEYHRDYHHKGGALTDFNAAWTANRKCNQFDTTSRSWVGCVRKLSECFELAEDTYYDPEPNEIVRTPPKLKKGKQAPTVASPPESDNSNEESDGGVSAPFAAKATRPSKAKKTKGKPASPAPAKKHSDIESDSGASETFATRPKKGKNSRRPRTLASTGSFPDSSYLTD